MTETAAGDVETAEFRRNCGAKEDRDESGQDRQSTEIKAVQD